MSLQAPITPGRLHGHEPEEGPQLDYDKDLLAGNLWEMDGQNNDRTSVDDFLQALDQAGIDTKDLRQAWQDLGRPTSSQNCLELIHAAAARCLRAGYDVYDSDTRTWVYARRVACEECVARDSACRKEAQRLLKANAAVGGVGTELVVIQANLVAALRATCHAKGTRTQGKDGCAPCKQARALLHGRLAVVPGAQHRALASLARDCLLDRETRESSQWDESAAKDHAEELDHSARKALGQPRAA